MEIYGRSIGRRFLSEYEYYYTQCLRRTFDSPPYGNIIRTQRNWGQIWAIWNGEFPILALASRVKSWALSLSRPEHSDKQMARCRVRIYQSSCTKQWVGQEKVIRSLNDDPERSDPVRSDQMQLRHWLNYKFICSGMPPVPLGVFTLSYRGIS